MRLGKAFLRFCTDRYQLLLSGSNVALERPFTVCIMYVIGFFWCVSSSRPRCPIDNGAVVRERIFKQKSSRVSVCLCENV